MYLYVHTQKVYAKHVSHIYVYTKTPNICVYIDIYTYTYNDTCTYYTKYKQKTTVYVQIQTCLPIHTCVEKKQKYVYR